MNRCDIENCKEIPFVITSLDNQSITLCEKHDSKRCPPFDHDYHRARPLWNGTEMKCSGRPNQDYFDSTSL